ncbi:transmembrane protein 201 isoform X2 [Callorhinchus milii]|uniref:transmembrane protein 201 isoform X2 n=1 Tax=Callorhinchus milii TaxID=7868 RepID=UPI001C3F9785|nr:transmembrane protein 201 isoform X2 [Callorhinchus milii]
MDTLSRVVRALPFPVTGTATATGIGCVCAAGALLYRAATRKKPTHVEVNCWFCSQDTTVPYGNRNCWDCPNCEQYNGFQENGDYNKPIPAQYMEHLNHMVTSWTSPTEASKVQQWPNGQLLFCKKCNSNQTLKVKQLASFVPRDEDRYEDEIEMYKHHLEQTYKLCRPCQTAVEYYIKHQDRQIRAILFDHQLRHREADKTFVQSSHYSGLSTPIRVVFLRFLAFVSCAMLLALALWEGPFDPRPPSAETRAAAAVAAGPSPAPQPTNGGNRTDPGPDLARNVSLWQELLSALPEDTLAGLRAAWSYGEDHQMAIVSTGLFTCLLAIILAGRIRLRRIDSVSSLLWLSVMGLHLAERYLQSGPPAWLDAAKLSATALCCLAGFAASVATRKSTGQRRCRARRSEQ